MARREIRDSAFKIIFEKSLRDDDLQSLYDIAEEIDEITVNDSVKSMVEGTFANIDEIDTIIKKYSPKRDIPRISKVNLAVLRLAFFELLYDKETPVNAVINEAVMISQTYSLKEDIAFVNGILGTYSRDLSKEANN